MLALLPTASRSSSPDLPCTLDRATGTTVDHKPFLSGAYGTRWNLATDRLAFMQPIASGYYRIYTMRPDGSDRVPLTDGRPGLPGGHHGMVYWHPSGRYLLFTAQKPDWKGARMFGSPDFGALPGFGVHDDMWLIAADGSRSWQLTNEPNAKQQGVLLPVFSPDGKRIAWGSRQPDKKYLLKLADFVELPQPHLENIVSLRPGDGTYFEPGSFTSDGKSLIYTTDQGTHNFWSSQIYRLDLASGTSTRLTAGKDYNEHPVVVGTPSGDWVVYMSTKGVNRRPFRLMLGTDWYAMRPDGSGAKRLTTMNLNRKDNPEDQGAAQVATTVAISPSGTFMLGDVQDSLVKQTGLIRVVSFTCK